MCVCPPLRQSRHSLQLTGCWSTGTNMRNSAARSNTSRQHSNLLECASLKREIQGALTAVFAGAHEDIGIGDPIPLPTHRNAL